MKIKFKHLVVLFILFWTLNLNIQIFLRLKALEKDLDSTYNNINSITQKNIELTLNIRKALTLEEQEKIAREKLLFAREGETVILFKENKTEALDSKFNEEKSYLEKFIQEFVEFIRETIF